MKEVKKVFYPNKTPPLGFEERQSNPPSPFEQSYGNYENFDSSQPFAPYASQPFDAPPSPPEQPRLSMVDHLVADIFGDPNPAMLVVPTCLLIILLCLHSLTHLCTPGQDCIGLHLMITPCQMITGRHGLKLLWTPIILFLSLLTKGEKTWE
jgi:hypothetical protein